MILANTPAVLSGVTLALNEGNLDGLNNIAPNWDVFPFIDLITKMVGGLWAIALILAVAAWIIAAIVWMLSRVIHSGMMQQYSGTVFVWCGIATILLGAAMPLVKYLAVQKVA